MLVAGGQAAPHGLHWRSASGCGSRLPAHQAAPRSRRRTGPVREAFMHQRLGVGLRPTAGSAWRSLDRDLFRGLTVRPPRHRRHRRQLRSLVQALDHERAARANWATPIPRASSGPAHGLAEATQVDRGAITRRAGHVEPRAGCRSGIHLLAGRLSCHLSFLILLHSTLHGFSVRPAKGSDGQTPAAIVW